MSSLLDLINSITIQASEEIRSYVFHNKEGKIHKVSSKNTLDDDYEVLEVSYNEVKDIMSGKKRLDDFKVEYDIALKCLALKEITYENKIASIDSRLYKLPETQELSDIRIVNDRKNNYWKILLDPELRKNKHFLERPGLVNLHFSITAKNDPNILYSTFIVNLKDLVERDFVEIDDQIKFDNSIKDLSIYTAKYLDTYAYELIE